MAPIQVTLPDNSVKSFNQPPTVLEVAESIGPGLAKVTLGAKLNGAKEVVDLRTTLKTDVHIEIVTTKSVESVEVVRHSTAHLLAQAVQEIWPDVKVTIGPVIEEGFYYDFDSPHAFSENDLPKIEDKMREIAQRKFDIVREVWTKEKALQVFNEKGERFKAEIIAELDGQEISVYRQGEWFDLCRGPHVRNVGELKVFKLLSVASSFWRGDENRETLQRIYGTAFVNKADLEDYVYRIEEAKKRDHRKLGRELDLFHFHDYSPAMPFFTRRGTIVYRELIRLMQDLYAEYGYQEVITPQVFDVALYKQSGHLENYKDNMYFTTVEGREFSLKPMNCPGHCLHYNTQKFSYRDLPYRIADFGRLHRSERSGAIHGLTRVRSFCQDDAHIFCTQDQMMEEIRGVMVFLDRVYKTLGMSTYKIFLSTRPEKRLGTDDVWDKAESALTQALQVLKLDYQVNPGDGAFYGPKLDIMFVDALKREWQLGTLQLDFNLPERFQLEYVGDDNSPHRPVMLHRAILGSLERFFGVYLEHVAGHFPTWLAPEQVRILNVTDRVNDYCAEIESGLKEAGVRVHFDRRNQKLSYKIREAQLLKIPYMVIVGDREAESRVVSVRLRHGETVDSVSLEQFISTLKKEVHTRSFEGLISHTPVEGGQLLKV